MEHTGNNSYEQIRQKQLEPYREYISRATEAACCIVTCANDSDAVASNVQTALVNSAERLGYTHRFVTWVYAGTGHVALRGSDLLAVIEALDPLCVVVTDTCMAQALADAYHVQIPLDCTTTLLGRPCVCFQNLQSLLSTQEGKHTAWKLLKQLPAL